MATVTLNAKEMLTLSLFSGWTDFVVHGETMETALQNYQVLRGVLSEFEFMEVPVDINYKAVTGMRKCIGPYKEYLMAVGDVDELKAVSNLMKRLTQNFQ